MAAANTIAAARSTAKIVFSGIQPTGIPHLGNYAGALRQWVKLQNTESSSTKLIYSIVDLHAITIPQPAEDLRKWRREALASLLAIGIDPERSTLFYQSAVPAHTELMWILSCTASMGYLSRMTQWKSKLNLSSSSSLEDKGVGSQLKLGLFSYPVLQAADILVHRATHVPVGQDQQQHLEFARECVTNFNHAYGKHLVHPETLTRWFLTSPASNEIQLTAQAPVHRVMSLNDPRSKMSKSNKSERSRILITDTPEQIRKKISSAVTDSMPGVSYSTVDRPGISNLLDILSIFDPEGRTASELGKAYHDLSPKQLKALVSDHVVSGLEGFGHKYSKILGSEQGYLDKVEAEGARKANESATETMEIVRAAMGMCSTHRNIC